MSFETTNSTKGHIDFKTEMSQRGIKQVNQILPAIAIKSPTKFGQTRKDFVYEKENSSPTASC